MLPAVLSLVPPASEVLRVPPGVGLVLGLVLQVYQGLEKTSVQRALSRAWQALVKLVLLVMVLPLWPSLRMLQVQEVQGRLSGRTISSFLQVLPVPVLLMMQTLPFLRMMRVVVPVVPRISLWMPM